MCAALLCWVSAESVKEYGIHRYKFICALIWGVTHWAACHETHACSTGWLKNSFIEFPENWSHVLVWYCVTDGWHTRHLGLLGEGSLWVDLKMCVLVAMWNKLGYGLVGLFLHDIKLAESALKSLADAQRRKISDFIIAYMLYERMLPNVRSNPSTVSLFNDAASTAKCWIRCGSMYLFTFYLMKISGI